MHSVLDLVAMTGFGTPVSLQVDNLPAAWRLRLVCKTGSQAGARGFSAEVQLRSSKTKKDSFPVAPSELRGLCSWLFLL